VGLVNTQNYTMIRHVFLISISLNYQKTH